MVPKLAAALLLLGVLVGSALAQTTGGHESGDSAGVPNGAPEIRQVYTSQVPVSGAGLMAELGGSGQQIQDQLGQIMGAAAPDLASLPGVTGDRQYQQHTWVGNPESYSPDQVNTRHLSATFPTPDGGTIQISYGAYGDMGSMADGGCTSCSLDANGGTIYITITAADGTVTYLHADFRDGGQMRFIEVSTAIEWQQSGDTLISGPATVPEDTTQSWTAVTGNIVIPASAQDVRFSYAWSTTDPSGGSGTAETFENRFTTPGTYEVALTVTVRYALDLPDLTCTGSTDPTCAAAATREEQPPEEFSDTLTVTVEDVTSPNLTLTLPAGTVVVQEAPPDAEPGSKVPGVQVQGTGFVSTTVDARDYGAIQTAPYRLDQNAPLTVQVTTDDNGGAATATWTLTVEGGGVSGTVDAAGGRVQELEANYPIGSVTYTLVAEAVDAAGNTTRITVPIEVVDVTIPEVDITLDHPPLDEDTFYDFRIASLLLQGDEGAPVPAEVPGIADFEEAAWAERPEVEDATLDGIPIAAALLGAGPLADLAEIRDVSVDASAGEARLRMLLLEPRPLELAVALKRRFRYLQRVGGGEIEKTERFLQARRTWVTESRS